MFPWDSFDPPWGAALVLYSPREVAYGAALHELIIILSRIGDASRNDITDALRTRQS